MASQFRCLMLSRPTNCDTKLPRRLRINLRMRNPTSPGTRVSATSLTSVTPSTKSTLTHRTTREAQGRARYISQTSSLNQNSTQACSLMNSSTSSIDMHTSTRSSILGPSDGSMRISSSRRTRCPGAWRCLITGLQTLKRLRKRTSARWRRTGAPSPGSLACTECFKGTSSSCQKLFIISSQFSGLYQILFISSLITV